MLKLCKLKCSFKLSFIRLSQMLCHVYKDVDNLFEIYNKPNRLFLKVVCRSIKNLYFGKKIGTIHTQIDKVNYLLKC